MITYIFATLLALVACVMCTTSAIMSYMDNNSINWIMLILGIANAICFVVDLYILIKDYLLKK